MIRNIFIVFFLNSIVAVIGLISSLLIPNILSIEDYAKYQTFLLYLGYVSLFHLGFPNGLNIRYAGKKIENIDKAQFKSEILLLMVTLCIFSSIAFLVSFAMKSQMMGFMAIMIFCYCFLSAIEQILQAFQKFGLYTICHILMSALPLLMPLLIYLFLKKINALACILSYVIIYVILTFVLIAYFFCISKKWKSKPLVNKNNIETEKVGLYFHIGILCVFNYNAKYNDNLFNGNIATVISISSIGKDFTCKKIDTNKTMLDDNGKFVWNGIFCMLFCCRTLDSEIFWKFEYH